MATPQDGLLCWQCGRPTGLVDRIVRSDQCPECGADVTKARTLANATIPT